MSGRVLVVGATGPLGSVITRKLVARGVPVRALARNKAKLEALGGAEIAAVDDGHRQPALRRVPRGGDAIETGADNHHVEPGVRQPAEVALHQRLIV